MGMFNKPGENEQSNETKVQFQTMPTEKTMTFQNQEEPSEPVSQKTSNIPERRPSSSARRGMFQTGFGVDEALQLLKQLPDNDDELMIYGVKTTLESVGVDIGQIIQDAQNKAENVKSQIAGVEDEIAALETQILEKSQTIDQHSDHLAELNNLKRRLEHAIRLEEAPSKNRHF
jgi:hypothetical protein